MHDKKEPIQQAETGLKNLFIKTKQTFERRKFKKIVIFIWT